MWSARSTILVALFSATALAQTFQIDWSTIDCGGGTFSSSADFQLSGTFGQPDAGYQLSGTSFALAGGFWPAFVPAPVAGDCDADGDVDLDDYAGFHDCLGGPGGGLLQPACECFDFDGDGDVDLFDFAEFQVGVDPAP